MVGGPGYAGPETVHGRAGERRRALGDTCQHRHPSAHVLHRLLEQLALLTRLERAVLADRAQHDHPVHAGRYHRVDMPQSRAEVERKVIVKMRDGGGKDALPVFIVHVWHLGG